MHEEEPEQQPRPSPQPPAMGQLALGHALRKLAQFNQQQ
jgi:hypothetical protein